MKANAYAAMAVNTPLVPYSFERRDLRPDDVAIDILYCGVCHSDLHFVRNDWGGSTYPLVPGHEIVGRVSAVGRDVRRHAVGDMVAVGTVVDSCLECDQCKKDEHQGCRKGASYTYCSPDPVTGEPNQGGYSTAVVVRDQFVLKVPAGLDPARAAPLLCAGITSYSPLVRYKAGPGMRVGVVGIGGLGHLAVKFAAAMGAEVTVITRSAGKQAEAGALGAKHVLLSTSEQAMAAAASSFDLIIDTIPVGHSIMPYVGLLDCDATLVLVGAIDMIEGFHSYPLLAGRRVITGSGTGGMQRTQQLLDFCATNKILPDCEVIPMQKINESFVRMEKGDVRYRFVIDMASLKQAA